MLILTPAFPANEFYHFYQYVQFNRNRLSSLTTVADARAGIALPAVDNFRRSSQAARTTAIESIDGITNSPLMA
jgi:hypothetical protein